MCRVQLLGFSSTLSPASIKSLNALGPHYLSNFLQHCISGNVWSADNGLFFLPKIRLQTCGSKAFQSPPPLEIHNAASLRKRKDQLKTHLYANAFASNPSHLQKYYRSFAVFLKFLSFKDVEKLFSGSKILRSQKYM